MAHVQEIKSWVRKWLLSYRFADYTAAEHMQMVEKVAVRVGMKRLEHADENIRLPVRSAAHYMAQSALRPLSSRCATELIAMVLLPIGLARWYLAGRGHKSNPVPKVAGVRWNQLEYRYRLNTDIFHTPQELAADAPQTVFVQARYLRWEDIKLLVGAVRAAWPVLPLFWTQWVFKLAKEMAWARPLIEHHPSDYALIDAECDCSLSVLTWQAHKAGQKLYNVMHGDKFRAASDAFFEADRCYCWNEFYVEQFKLLHARSDFRVYTNPTFVLSEREKAIVGEGVGVFMPIEETLPTEAELQAFANALNQMAEHYAVRLRPHPMQMNQCDRIVPLLSSKVEITAPRAETSRDFILRHAVIVGSVSTALLESVLLGRQTVCFNCAYGDDLASYHFMYQMSNCALCPLESLDERVAQAMPS